MFPYTFEILTCGSRKLGTQNNFLLFRAYCLLCLECQETHITVTLLRIPQCQEMLFERWKRDIIIPASCTVGNNPAENYWIELGREVSDFECAPIPMPRLQSELQCLSIMWNEADPQLTSAGYSYFYISISWSVTLILLVFISDMNSA